MQQENNYNRIEAKDVLDATNNGLDIILYLYPQAQEGVMNKKHKFKLRDTEKTASANLYQNRDDQTWLVTDFGGDGVRRNGIMCWAFEKNISFVEALYEVAAKFNVAGRTDDGKDLPRSMYSEAPADPDIPENKWTWEARTSFTDFEIETILSANTLKFVKWKNADETIAKDAYARIVAKFEYYRWRSLISYSIVKNGKKMTFSATDEYPMFIINEGKHQKLYQPKHPDKGKRFLYIGEKPKHFIHGLEQLEKLYNKKKEEQLDDDDDDEDTDKKKKEYKLDEAIICSGGSDAINVALLGYQVLWLNSETEGLQEWQYKKLDNMVEKLYQLQDIDHTGKASAHKMAMAYLDIYTIELPERLREKRDARRNPCKDLRDYLNHWDRWDFKQLFDTALPYRFWERTPNYAGRGDKQVFVGYKYTYRIIQGNNFLSKNGFGRLVINEKKNEWIYVQRTGNVVREVDAGMIQDYLHSFLEHGYYDLELREAMASSGRLNESTLSGLKVMDIDFTDFTPTSQFIFFKNKAVEVTPGGIKYHQPGAVNKFIWEDELHNHSIEAVKQAPFEITRDPDLGTYYIKINDTTCPYFKYLIQTSRMHWRTEMETGEKYKALTPAEQDDYKIKYHCCIDGPNLSPEEVEEQKQHLINKLFVIGWHLHRYKDPTKGWFSFAMDGKMSEDGKSHGGSGKSLTFDRALRIMLPKNMVINGRNAKLVEGEFKYDGVNDHTRYVLVDDAFEYLKLDQFYVDVSGDMEVNPKGKTKFTIKYERAPKLAFTSNYIPRDVGPSTERRILYYVVSDYYHNKGESDDYLEHRTPKTDLGLSLFTDFDRDQWNSFYNVMLHALQFFLTTDEKVRPAMDNVNRRQLLAMMGENFHEWANAYFNPDTGRLDKYFVREEAYKMFNLASKTDITSQAFKKKLAAWAKYYNFIFNPKEYLGKNKNNIQKMEVRVFKQASNTWEPVVGAAKEPKEVFFIQTRDALPADPFVGWPEVIDDPAAGDDRVDF